MILDLRNAISVNTAHNTAALQNLDIAMFRLKREAVYARPRTVTSPRLHPDRSQMADFGATWTRSA